jgi:hypothetical protein
VKKISPGREERSFMPRILKDTVDVETALCNLGSNLNRGLISEIISVRNQSHGRPEKASAKRFDLPDEDIQQRG